MTTTIIMAFTLNIKIKSHNDGDDDVDVDIIRGEIAASVGRAFVIVKLRQRHKVTPTHPELLGRPTI